MKLIIATIFCMLTSSCSVSRQVMREGAGYTARAIIFLVPSVTKSRND